MKVKDCPIEVQQLFKTLFVKQRGNAVDNNYLHRDINSVDWGSDNNSVTLWSLINQGRFEEAKKLPNYPNLTDIDSLYEIY